MALFKCPDCGKDVSESAPSCPNCGRPFKDISKPGKKKSNPLATGCLVICLIILVFIVIGIVISLNQPSQKYTETSAPLPPAEPQLELVAFSWHEEYTYAILEGQIKNISKESMKSVEAVASFYDEKGGFITSSEALIEYNPILPGQTSPFKVMATWNPAMKKAGVEFKFLMGGTILTRQSSKK
jgi:hypothetical protein